MEVAQKAAQAAQVAPGQDFASEAEHWYKPDGSPAYTVTGANGKERPATLRDARKLGLYPSVSKIIDAAAKPGLERWKAEQLLMAALTLPRNPGETEKNWISRVWVDSKEQAIKAAARGSAIHAAIEKRLRGEPVEPEFEPFVRVALAAIAPLGLTGISSERSFASPLGYGGKLDLLAKEAILDFKTKDGDLVGEKLWDNHLMQLAAYDAAAYDATTGGRKWGIVFVSRTDPAAKLVMAEPEEIERGWAMFQALLRYWQAASGYRPGC